MGMSSRPTLEKSVQLVSQNVSWCLLEHLSRFLFDSYGVLASSR